ncbi:MAG: protein phosphatase 2C domain-containing protein [Betaproteobacteria bacterium]|nr:protein phosphatase 2C domain-containing protein [Betaproteobacteria bacterium]
MRFSIYQASRQGGRNYNEDRIAYSYSRDALLMVVADGMGGHSHGEIAAQLTVKTLTEAFQRHAHPKLRDPSGFLHGAIHRAHEAINQYATEQRLNEAPHTTCVACVIQDDTAWWAHVGDSRLYLFSDNNLILRTHDHSAVQQMFDEGKISEAEMSEHPDRNKVYNCVGGYLVPEIELSRPMPLTKQDRILICTDGLWGQVTTEQIATTLSRFPLARAVEFLMDHAELRGGRHGDNLSAIALTWESPDESEDYTVSTVAMAENTFTTKMSSYTPSPADLAEEEVERVIAEIQHTIRKFSDENP